MWTKELTIVFTDQQLELLEKLKAEGNFGSDYETIVVAIFRDFMKRQFVQGGGDD